MGEPIVQVVQGLLRGKLSRDSKGNNYYCFQGIPYAKPPVGHLRFMAPQPAEPWQGIRNATLEGSESISKHALYKNNIGSEDCLTLNVYTSTLDKREKPKAVMVWIHGGGFITGSSKLEVYGPDYLITKDIIFVSINYRLGLLGFMKFDDPALKIPGNAGLKDMVQALKWVQNNIKQFNGDPNNVTIFGESAGSAACHLLVLSPTTKGLFHRAILQSGVAINPWCIGSTGPLKIAKLLGFLAKDEKDAFKFLKSVPAKKLLDTQNLLRDNLDIDESRPIGPVVEQPSPEAFLSEHPLDILLSGNYNKVPIMLGYNSREGILMEIVKKQNASNGIIHHRLRDFEKAVPYYYNLEKGSELSKTVAKKIEEFYYSKSKTPKALADSFYLLYTDAYWVRGIHIAIKEMLKSQNQKLYFYRFNLDTKLNTYKKIGKISNPGACHCEDLCYLFKSVTTPEVQPNSIEEIAVDRLSKLWTNFAKTGNPNPVVPDPRINVTWPAVTSTEIKCLDIDRQLSVIENPEKERMAFWDSISSLDGIKSIL